VTLNIDDSEIIFIDDGKQPILNSNFDPQRPVKVIIHGFKGSGRDKGAPSGVDALLKLVINIIQSTEN
jgi:hypothetical protein